MTPKPQTNTLGCVHCSGKNDNFNLSIAFEEKEIDGNMHMTYGDPSDSLLCEGCQ